MNQPKPATNGISCESAQAALLDLVYHELSESAAAPVHAHLKTCTTCHDAYQQLAGTAALLDRVPEQEVRIDLAQLCLAGAEQWQRSQRRWRFAALTSLAAMVVAVSSLALWALLGDLQFDHQRGGMLVTWGGGQPQPAPAASPIVPAVEIAPRSQPKPSPRAPRTMINRSEFASSGLRGKLPVEWEELGEYWQWRAQVLVGPELARGEAPADSAAMDAATIEITTPTYQQLRDELLLQ